MYCDLIMHITLLHPCQRIFIVNIAFSCRYTEGDFHHLKRSKIDRSVHRQYSTGVASINGSRNWFDEAALRASIEEQFKEARRKSKPEIIPMVDLNESPSPPMRPVKTEIAVEVHHQQNHRVLDKFVKSESLDGRKDFKAAHPQCVRVNAIQKCSHSLDTTTPSQSRVYRETRKVKSYEDVPDYDVLKITEFSKGPCYNTDFEIISELGSSLKCKVSYNDTGSLEQLNEEQVEYLNDLDLDSVMLGDSDETETLNGTQKYRELWNLRATLEEEDECSDTIRMEDMTSPEESPDREPCTTSFESNAEAPSDAGVSDQRDSGIQWESSIKASAKHLLHPNYENRRQNYKSILTRRLQKAGPNTSTENSFDSVETDGDISDTSRYEVTTTSFESTTDNTDSTTESQTSRLRQMKTDSGYKSLETQQSAKEGAEGERDISPGTYQAEKQIQKALQKSPQKSPEHVEEAGPSDSPKLLFKRCGNASHFERRNGKTASKKRRAYSRERQMVRVYESINEPETDSKSELPSGDSFEDNTVPNKISVFARFFKFHSREYRERYLTRDYSIDEKTNKIFNDFIRHDSLDPTKCGVRRSPKLHHRHRLQRKHTEPVVGQEQRRNRLAPDMRSASLGSDSSASSVRRPSPQDSIEEEECIELISGAPGTWEAMETQEDPELASAAKPVHDIPIIKLPEEETAEVSQT